MKGKAAIPLVLGLGMGLVAIKMGLDIIDSSKGATVDTVQVVVAKQLIEAASRIDKDMLKLVDVPKTLVPPGSFQKIDKVVERVSAMYIATGLPISQEMLAPPGADPGLPSQIPDGFRAIAVKVDEATAVAGFVMPKHRVDIYSIDSAKGASRTSLRPVSRLLLEDVEVGAVGQSIKSVDPDGKSTRVTRTVTLYVKPEDVASLDVASRGPIRLVLRGISKEEEKDADKTVETLPRIAMEKPGVAEGLLGFMGALASNADRNEPAVTMQPSISLMPAFTPPVAVAPPAPHIVEIHRGRQSSERVTFVDEESMKKADGNGSSSSSNRYGGSRVAPPTLPH
jgi:pilus assembly protein CpaB